MHQNQKEYENLINGLSEDNFNHLIKEFVKEYYQTKEVFISDGPYDGGLDLIYSKNGSDVKKNIQITVQKEPGLIKKIEKDVKKASSNIKNYGYQNNLDFYTSSSLTNTKKNKLIQNAEIEQNVSLKIIDATRLAGIMPEFPSIKNSLRTVYSIDNSESIFDLSKQAKILYNIIATGEDSAKIKRHLVHAHIITSLFESPNQTLDDLYISIENSLTGSLTKESLFNEVNYLKSKDYISGNKSFQLSETSADRLNEILELNLIQEQEISSKIQELLSSYNLDDKAGMISKKLIQLYLEHFEFDTASIESTDSSFTKSTKKIFIELCQILKELGVEESLKEEVAKNILRLSGNNEFLIKLGASAMYIKLYNSDRLAQFISSSNRLVCLDTQVLLRLICVLYNPSSRDYSLKVVNEFFQAAKQSNIPLTLITTEDYIEEVAAHLQKALKIYHYIKLPLFKKVGRTRNVFYNYYRELLRSNVIGEMDFRVFVEGELLGIKIPDEFDSSFIEIIVRRLVRVFENLNLDVVFPPFYSDFQLIKKEFEIELAYSGLYRSGKAIVHDVRTALFMSDEINHFDSDEELVLEPYVVTWDSQFYTLRKIVKKKLNKYDHWFVYTPQKFIEKIQLTQFKIKPNAINEIILSIVESDYNSANSKRTFLDVISTIFNKEDVSELKLAQKFANLEEQYISETEPQTEFTRIIQDESPLTVLLGILISHFHDQESAFDLSDFTKLCEDDEKADQIIQIILVHFQQLAKETFDKSILIKDIEGLMQNDA